MTPRFRVVSMSLVCLSMLVAVAAQAQEAQAEGGLALSPEDQAMMEAWQEAMTPGEAHARLAELAGSWTMTISSWVDPASEPMISTGTVERAMIMGGRVLSERVETDMMGQPFTGLGYSGYDNTTGHHWTTWMDSMSTGVFVASGAPEASGAIVYHGEYHDPMTSEMIRVRSVTRPETDGVQIFEWYEDRGEGELKTMEIAYRRADG